MKMRVMGRLQEKSPEAIASGPGKVQVTLGQRIPASAFAIDDRPNAAHSLRPANGDVDLG